MTTCCLCDTTHDPGACPALQAVPRSQPLTPGAYYLIEAKRPPREYFDHAGRLRTARDTDRQFIGVIRKLCGCEPQVGACGSLAVYEENARQEFERRCPCAGALRLAA